MTLDAGRPGARGSASRPARGVAADVVVARRAARRPASRAQHHVRRTRRRSAAPGPHAAAARPAARRLISWPPRAPIRLTRLRWLTDHALGPAGRPGGVDHVRRSRRRQRARRSARRRAAVHAASSAAPAPSPAPAAARRDRGSPPCPASSLGGDHQPPAPASASMYAQPLRRVGRDPAAGTPPPPCSTASSATTSSADRGTSTATGTPARAPARPASGPAGSPAPPAPRSQQPRRRTPARDRIRRPRRLRREQPGDQRRPARAPAAPCRSQPRPARRRSPAPAPRHLGRTGTSGVGRHRGQHPHEPARQRPRRRLVEQVRRVLNLPASPPGRPSASTLSDQASVEVELGGRRCCTASSGPRARPGSQVRRRRCSAGSA